MMASGHAARQAGHKGATDRIFCSCRSAAADPKMTTALLVQLPHHCEFRETGVGDWRIKGRAETASPGILS